jgi:arginine repressor
VIFIPENTKDGVRTRLSKFLVKDKIGIRKCLLNLFLQTKNYTTCEIYDHLKKQGFEVNYRAVSAMVGQMHTRLGILRIYLKREHRCYSLKEDHRDIVKMILTTPIFTGKSLHPIP